MVIYPTTATDDSESFTSSEIGSSTQSYEGDGENDEKKTKILQNKEHETVVGLRFLVFTVLFLAMVGTAVMVYFYISGNETRQFEQQFREDSQQVLASIGSSLDLTLGGLDALVVSLVSYARASNQTWPYVTIPDFGVRAEKIRSLTNAVYLNLYMYVPPDERYKWENYSALMGRGWVEESLDMQKREGAYQEVIEELNATNVTYWDVIHDYDEWDKENAGEVGLDPDDPGPFLPMWQTAPLIPVDPPYNWDLMSVPLNQSLLSILETHQISITEAYLVAFENDTASIEENRAEADWISSYVTTGEEPMEPISDIYYPILDQAADLINVQDEDYDPSQHKIGGLMSASIYWRDVMKGILPDGSNGIRVVVDNPCNPSFTYQINGPRVEFLGVKDAHEGQFDYMGRSSLLVDLNEYSVRGRAYTGIPVNEDFCPFTVRVYPSTVMLASFTTSQPIIYPILVVCVFVFVSAVFLLYDFCVERRQKVVMQSAKRTNAIVENFFPSNVRDRIIEEQQNKQEKKQQEENKNAFLAESHKDPYNDDDNLPIADYFPETTILFADLAGFTSWSSTREPAQVFKLLETLYGCFDNVARRRGVFKVETIGDCYVAVTGLPKPRRQHAVIMARFAADCRQGMNERTQELELNLGPGTADLKLRVGLHSGGVTAGVLRGDKARFQLFGDTMNTASRMESNGQPGRIQCSQKTAFLLIESGKDDWLTKRDELVEAKGKGKMQTYWVEPKRGTFSMASSEAGWVSDFNLTKTLSAPLDPTERLVDWSVSVFEEFIKILVAERRSCGVTSSLDVSTSLLTSDVGRNPRSEIVDSVSLPTWGQKNDTPNPSEVQLPSEVVEQLRSYVSVISHSYRSNAFHSFDHASNVTMFTKKLCQRMNTTKSTMRRRKDYVASFALPLHPLAQVAMLVASLVHDVDHPGVSNAQIAVEDSVLASRYGNKSVTQQNSLDIAWKLFMEPEYADLRSYLFASNDDITFFRQVLVTSVMATDIVDPELRADREKRWNMAFSESAVAANANESNVKGLILVEHILQASDWWHTVHNWPIYQKWNKCLFEEEYAAYLAGRIETDPSEHWFYRELEFFDTFVIPLARKLQESYVFGPSGHELLDFANVNRAEWECRGKELIEEMKSALQHTAIVEL